MASSTREPTGTQSVERTIAILRELATYGSRGARVSEIAENLGLEYPTAHRIVRCLVDQRMAEKDVESLRYSLGSLVYELGLSVPPRMNLRELCDPITSRIALTTGDTVFLNVRSGLDVLCIDRKEGTFPIKTLVFEIGNRRPLGIGAGGIALLMQLSEKDLAEILAVNSPRFQTYGKLSTRSIIALLRRSKEVGYVVTHDIVVRGVSAISIPFGGDNGIPAAAISVACVPSRMPQSRHRELVALLRAEIKSLEHSMRAGPQSARRVA